MQCAVPIQRNRSIVVSASFHLLIDSVFLHYTGEGDLRSVMRALDGNVDRAENIAAVLRIKSKVIKEIKETTYRNHPALWPIASMTAWLRGRHDKTGYQSPYTDTEPHASWWSLVFAVDLRTGGDNRDLARSIAENYKGYIHVFYCNLKEPYILFEVTYKYEI